MLHIVTQQKLQRPKTSSKINDMSKIEKKIHRYQFFGYENKEKHLVYIYIYQKNGVKKKTIDLLLIVEEGKRH